MLEILQTGMRACHRNEQKLCYYNQRTERRGSKPASYSGGPDFKYRCGDRLSSLRFIVVFISTCASPGRRFESRPDLTFRWNMN